MLQQAYTKSSAMENDNYLPFALGGSLSYPDNFPPDHDFMSQNPTTTSAMFMNSNDYRLCFSPFFSKPSHDPHGLMIPPFNSASTADGLNLDVMSPSFSQTGSHSDAGVPDVDFKAEGDSPFYHASDSDGTMDYSVLSGPTSPSLTPIEDMFPQGMMTGNAQPGSRPNIPIPFSMDSLILTPETTPDLEKSASRSSSPESPWAMNTATNSGKPNQFIFNHPPAPHASNHATTNSGVKSAPASAAPRAADDNLQMMYHDNVISPRPVDSLPPTPMTAPPTGTASSSTKIRQIYPSHAQNVPALNAPPPPRSRNNRSAVQNRRESKQPRIVRLIGEGHIDRLGQCYIYSDGTHCPKWVKGELVNANWGLTKAGKPRKRLAQACVTCRDRKIKCHPAAPKCEQCQRSGKTCRFENA